MCSGILLCQNDYSASSAVSFELRDCRENDIWSDAAVLTVEDGYIYAVA